MEITKIEVIDRENLDMPDVLYKYRDWSDPYHRNMISNGEVYFSSPSKFEDEFDCKKSNSVGSINLW